MLHAEDEDIGGERVTLPNALCWGGEGGAAKGLRRSPLRRMKRLEVVMQDMIRSIQADRKLKQMRVCLIISIPICRKPFQDQVLLSWCLFCFWRFSWSE